MCAANARLGSMRHSRVREGFERPVDEFLRCIRTVRAAIQPQYKLLCRIRTVRAAIQPQYNRRALTSRTAIRVGDVRTMCSKRPRRSLRLCQRTRRRWWCRRFRRRTRPTRTPEMSQAFASTASMDRPGVGISHVQRSEPSYPGRQLQHQPLALAACACSWSGLARDCITSFSGAKLRSIAPKMPPARRPNIKTPPTPNRRLPGGSTLTKKLDPLSAWETQAVQKSRR